MAAGTKRKEHATEPEPQHQPKAAKTQTTLDEHLETENGSGAQKDTDMQNAPPEEEKPSNGSKSVEQPKEESDKQETQPEPKDESKGETEETKEPKAETKCEKQGQGAMQEDPKREEKLPSNILERGIIYFFTRNRVGIEDSSDVGDLQRTYFVLRPLTGDKIGEGPIPDEKVNRLFALPKKTFPKSARDRFMTFVEKSNVTIKELKDTFFQGSEYETKTQGTRHQSPVAPIGEGVYAITRSEDDTTHLAYSLTIPEELGEVQKDLGLKDQGSFIMSIKNPERGGPANARLPEGPKFPKEIIEEFRGLAWGSVKPKYLDYENAQILFIGEDIEKAVEPTTKDQKHDKVTPKEELEQLEHEDELRVKRLNGDDTVFDDLKISKKDYLKVPSTW